MIAISPLSNNSYVSLDLQHEQADVYVARNALDEAVAAIERAGGPREPWRASSDIKLDPRVAKMLDIYVRGAEAGEDRATARVRIEAAIAQGNNARLSLKGLGLRRDSAGHAERLQPGSVGQPLVRGHAAAPAVSSSWYWRATGSGPCGSRYRRSCSCWTSPATTWRNCRSRCPIG